MGRSGMVRNVLGFALVVGLVLATSSALAKDADARRTLTVGYVEFPPLEFQTEDGRADGTFVTLTRQVAAEAGYDVEFVYLPISRAYFYLKNGVIDLWPGLTQIPELAGHVLESEVSPIPVTLSAWYTEDVPPVSRFESFNDHILILIAGYTYGGLLTELENSRNIRVTYAPNHLAALQMLERKRGHYLLDYEFPVREVMAEHKISGLQETEVRTRFTSWLFSRQSPRHPQLRSEFDAAYRRLAARGEVPVPVDKRDSYNLPGLPPPPRVPVP